MWSRILAAKKLLSNINSPVQVQLPLPSTICCHFRQLLRKILCRISISQSSFEMLFQHLSLRSLLNVTSAVRQAVERTSWFKKRQRYRVLYWREISPLAVPILLENACVLLMGVLSTFLVSWLGKEAMAGVGRPIALTWSSCPSLPPSIWVPRWWWPLASASAIGGGRGRPRASRWSL